MSTATYHKKKLYIPKEVQETLELSDGDQAEIEVIDNRSFKVYLTRKSKQQTSSVEKRMIDRILNKPLRGKLSTRHFRREDYYDKDQD